MHERLSKQNLELSYPKLNTIYSETYMTTINRHRMQDRSSFAGVEGIKLI